MNEQKVEVGGEGRELGYRTLGFSLGWQQAYFQMETDVL